MPKQFKPFFVTDADGKLYKASPVKDEEIPFDEDEEKRKEAGAKVHDDEGLTPEDIAWLKTNIAELKALLAERAEAKHDEEGAAAAEGHDESGYEADKQIEQDMNKDKVVDTAAKDSKAKKGFGSTEIKDAKTTQTSHNIEVESAWAKRYGGKD